MRSAIERFQRRIRRVPERRNRCSTRQLWCKRVLSNIRNTQTRQSTLNSTCCPIKRAFHQAASCIAGSHCRASTQERQQSGRSVAARSEVERIHLLAAWCDHLRVCHAAQIAYHQVRVCQREHGQHPAHGVTVAPHRKRIGQRRHDRAKGERVAVQHGADCGLNLTWRLHPINHLGRREDLADPSEFPVAHASDVAQLRGYIRRVVANIDEQVLDRAKPLFQVIGSCRSSSSNHGIQQTRHSRRSLTTERVGHHSARTSTQAFVCASRIQEMLGVLIRRRHHLHELIEVTARLSSTVERRRRQHRIHLRHAKRSAAQLSGLRPLLHLCSAA